MSIATGITLEELIRDGFCQPDSLLLYAVGIIEAESSTGYVQYQISPKKHRFKSWLISHTSDHIHKEGGEMTIDIIFNMTSVCPHDCPVCCIDATHVTRRGDKVVLRTDGLKTKYRIHHGDRTKSIYDVAASELQTLGRELSLDQKLTILSNIDVQGVRLDISGGDPLVVTDNITVLAAASSQLGRHNISLTATGSGLVNVNLSELVQLVSEFNFTYDSASADDVSDRPKSYAASNLAVARKLSALGAVTRAEFPITRSTNNEDHLKRLYMHLHEAGVNKLLLMRLFPSGRGATVEDKTLTRSEYLAAVFQLRRLELEFGSPAVKLQCALRHIESGTDVLSASAVNPCDMVTESFGLTPLGDLLASPWAINGFGAPHPDYVLGNLLETRLSEILRSQKVDEFRRRANENFGHCKIFAERFSLRKTTFERMHDKTDPLYSAQSIRSIAAE